MGHRLSSSFSLRTGTRLAGRFSRSSPRACHRVPQQPVRPGLITFAISLQPFENILVKAQGNGFLRRATKLAHLRATPIQNLWHIGEINVCVVLCRDGADVSLLLFCLLPHIFFSRVLLQLVPK